LIRLGGLAWPDRLAGVVIEPTATLDGFSDEAEGRAGEHWILDGADWWLSESVAITSVVRRLSEAAADVWVHLHQRESPAWANAREAGPLFASREDAAAPSSGDWLAALGDHLRPIWHWHGEPAQQSIFLESCKRHAAAGILFDRVRRPLVLSRGMSRQRPALLLEVELHLPRLLELPEVGGQGERLLEKLPSLVRMAVSAAGQKRKYLRRHAEHLGRGFLLDRAIVRLIPCGLDDVVHRLLNVGVTGSKLARNLGRRILSALHDPLAAAHRGTGLNLSLAAPPEPIAIPPSGATTLFETWSELVRGVTEGVVTIAFPEPPRDRPVDLLPLFDHVFRETDLAGVIWDDKHETQS
jgi:hypothetical protein